MSEKEQEALKDCRVFITASSAHKIPNPNPRSLLEALSVNPSTPIHNRTYDVFRHSMPPRLAVSTKRAITYALPEQQLCFVCLHKSLRRRFARSEARLAKPIREPPSRWSRARRTLPAVNNGIWRYQELNGKRRIHNASLASATAINAPSTVPRELRELHQSLVALQETAGSYVDLARLQLATRSLESTSPVLRVAFLGIGKDGFRAARKLARVLLSDALSEEEPWESELVNGTQDGRSILLRYGDISDPVPSSPLVMTMHVPSPYLRRHNVEILVSALSANDAASNAEMIKSTQDAILVPSLTTPNSTDGRVGFVRYPVHKTVLVAEGIEGAVQYGRLSPTIDDGALVMSALSVPLRLASGTESGEEEASTNSIDIDLAAHGLDLFRANKANGARFSQEWQTSRVSAVGQWAAGTPRSESSRIDPAVGSLISSVLESANRSVARAVSTTDLTAAASTVPESKRQHLQSIISDWSAEAHRDLQMNLDSAFATSASWRRTVWWRLFWRIDDVAISASEVLHRNWLKESEQALAFVSGRIAEAGLATREQLQVGTPDKLGENQTIDMLNQVTLKEPRESSASLTQMPSMIAKLHGEDNLNAQVTPPWPQTIALSRQYMVSTLVPDLHRKAQALLVTTLSTIGGSAALSGWFWLATRGTGIYESGAIVALGLVWSLRRLQTKWGKERDGFAVAVREDARRVLREVEGHLRKLVSDGARTAIRPEDAESWRKARSAVAACQSALEDIDKS